MSKQKRRTFTPEEKATILRKHFVDKRPVSDICDEHGIQPSHFYLWQKQAMENLEGSLQDRRSRRHDDTRATKAEQKVERLEAKLAHKDEVIAEISEMLIAEKKRGPGES